MGHVSHIRKVTYLDDQSPIKPHNLTVEPVGNSERKPGAGKPTIVDTHRWVKPIMTSVAQVTGQPHIWTNVKGADLNF